MTQDKLPPLPESLGGKLRYDHTGSLLPEPSYNADQMHAYAEAALAAARAEADSLRADAERWKACKRMLSTGHIPGAAHGRRIKLVETCPMYGEEKEVLDFERAIDAAIAAKGKQS